MEERTDEATVNSGASLPSAPRKTGKGGGLTDRPDDRRRDELLDERAQKPGRPGPQPPDHDQTEDRLLETERRKQQLQEAWRRRRTPSGPRANRPGDEGK